MADNDYIIVPVRILKTEITAVEDVFSKMFKIPVDIQGNIRLTKKDFMQSCYEAFTEKSIKAYNRKQQKAGNLDKIREDVIVEPIPRLKSFRFHPNPEDLPEDPNAR